MAEAFLKNIYRERFEAYSAGTHPGKLNPYVVRAMDELDIDISSNRTKSVDEFQGVQFDYVITVCDSAKAECPFFPGAVNYLHQSFPDPSFFFGTNAEIIVQVRKVRNEIKGWIKETFRAGTDKLGELNIYL